MNKTTEALKMAIEALEHANERSILLDAYDDVINACKEALEQPEQEPVAWVRTKNGEIDWDDDCLGSDKDSLIESACDPENKFNEYDAIPLYTHPAPSWQGLSDDEILKFVSTIEEIKPQHGMMLSNEWNILDFARAIEQALKEKNER